MNVDPRIARDAKEWVEYSTGPLSRLIGVVPVLADNMHWVEWGYLVLQNPAVQKFSPPDPRYFSNWQEWAFRFNQAVPL
jgi:hypothetical protein